MLYSNDEENDRNEENRKNIKNKNIAGRNIVEFNKIHRIALLISCVIIMLIIFVGSFILTYNGKNNDSTNNLEEKSEESKNNDNNVNEEENKNVEDVSNSSSTENTNNIVMPTKNEDNKAVKYIGTHEQIPVHTEENISKGLLPVEIENANEVVRNLYFSDEKQVYLTFDDGPSKEVTPTILDILKENNVPATFFVLGARVETNPDLVLREYNEGHYIANHGYSHKYSQIYSSVDSVYDEYVKTEKAVQTALSNDEYKTLLFRFPGGSSGGPYDSLKSKAKANMISKGIACTNWNSLTGDAEGLTKHDDLINRMISTSKDSDTVILLMHDAGDKTYTAEALQDVINYFKEKDYTFKNFYDIFK